MSIEIYKADFSTRYEMTHAISLQMSNHYNAIGKIQIVAPASDYNIQALKPNNIVYDTLRGTTYIIVSSTCDTVENRITASGYSANWLLNKRIVANPTVVNTIETGVYGLINSNLRSLPRISTGTAKGLNAVYGGDVEQGEGLTDAVIPVLDSAGYGHRMVWDAENNEWIFEVYYGQDLTSGIHAIVFSEEFGTASELVIDEDISQSKTVAYVKYALSDDTEPIAIVGNATGEDRKEIFFDTSVTQEEDEPATDCEARAIAYATMELGKYKARKSFSIQIDPSELGSLYNVGDLVSCVSVRFDVAFNARITGAEYTMDATGEKTSVILGDPVLTVIDELKLNQRR